MEKKSHTTKQALEAWKKTAFDPDLLDLASSALHEQLQDALECAGRRRYNQLPSGEIMNLRCGNIHNCIALGIGVCITAENAKHLADHVGCTTWDALAAHFGAEYRTVRNGQILMLFPALPPCMR